MNHALRAFRHRNFRLFYAGQAISLIGTWIQQIALSWLVYRTTGSGFLLGLVTFCSQIPMLIFVPLAGLLSDRFDRRKLMIAAYALAAAQASTLGLLTLTGTIRMWQILALGFLYGVIMAFETPARQSLISQMVDSRDDLPNAIALNSVLMNSGRLIGPSIAGLLLVFISEGWCFLINAASFTAIIASALMMRLPSRKATVVHHSLLHDLRCCGTLCLAHAADTLVPAARRPDQSDSVALHGTDADIRARRFRWRRTHIGISGRQRRVGCRCRNRVSCDQTGCIRTQQAGTVYRRRPLASR